MIIRIAPLLFCLLLACDADQELPVEGAPAAEQAQFELPSFELTERSGDAVTKETLLGAPWIAGFAFTRCSGPCPKLSGLMASLQPRLEGTPVKLVTFSVDPEHDTPQVLQDYAKAFSAQGDRWWFLTGERENVYDLINQGFRLGVQENASAPVGESIAHSTRLALVDAKGQVRGFFSSESPEAVDRLVERARALAGE
ncbi:MAG: SCO family protein [Planctomycetota bacterium]